MFFGLFFLLLLLVALPVAVRTAMPGLLMAPQFAPHHREGRFRNGNLVGQNLDGVLVARAARVAMLAVQLMKIVGRLRIESPENVADRAGFYHSSMLQEQSGFNCTARHRVQNGPGDTGKLFVFNQRIQRSDHFGPTGAEPKTILGVTAPVGRSAYTKSVPTCHGSFRALLLYDIAEEFDVAKLGKLLGAEPPARSPGFKLSAPGYVRFERAPLTETCEPILLATGETAHASMRFFDYGVVSLEVELPFETDWPGLIALSNRWIEAGEVEQRALKHVRDRVNGLTPALTKPYAEWIDEAYYIVDLRAVYDSAGRRLLGQELLTEYGREVSLVIRGETQSLSDVEQKEVLSSSLSYYPSDLLVVGWLAAIVYDSTEGAAPMIQLLEYANTQLLEYRRYDEILTALLKDTYALLERRRGLFSRWRLARDAEHLNRLRLDVTELTERADNAIKFLSDMFYARAYRMAAGKVGAGDYRSLVDQKLRIAEELYEFMVNEFRESRGFFLEIVVIVILIIELVPIFRGK